MPRPFTATVTIFPGGPSGPPGPEGDPGVGVPAGGTAAQVLTKIDSTDFNTEWTAQLAGDVDGPVSSTNNHVVFFNGTTGKIIKDSGLTLSGSNTGDQIITLTGDVTGTGTGSFAATLASTAVTPGSYTNTNLTVDAKGRITAAATGSSAATTWGSITGMLSSQTDLQTALLTKQPIDTDLTTLAGLTATTNNFIVSVAGAWASRTPSDVRTTLGLVIGTDVQAHDVQLDSVATLSYGSNALKTIRVNAGETGFELATASAAVAWGGITGTVSDQTDLQAELDARQPLDTDLTTLAGLTATTNNFIISVAGAWASRTPSDARTTLGLVIGTNVQAWDADLDTWATKTPYAGTLTITTGKTVDITNSLTLSGTDGSTLAIGTGGTLGTAAYTSSGTYQPLDSDLTTIASLTATTDNFIVSVAGAWASRTPTNVRSTLGLVIGTDVQAFDSDLTTWAGITPATGVGTFLVTPSSANLIAAMTDETGTGACVFANTPTLVTPILGTPTSGDATNLTNLNATQLTSGTIPAARMPALSGDVQLTVGTVNTMTIVADAVSYAKMQNVSATDKVLGRSTAGTGDVEEIACTAAGRALIDDANAAAQVTTLGLDNTKITSIGFTSFDATAISTGKVKGFFTCPYAGSITAWNIVADAGTCTIQTWKIATGTAKPTVANSISTSGVSLATGTAIHSTTVSDFTSTTVTANDIFAFNIGTISGVTELSFNLQITKS